MIFNIFQNQKYVQVYEYKKENKLEIENRKLKIPYQNIYVENEVLVELLDYE